MAERGTGPGLQAAKRGLVEAARQKKRGRVARIEQAMEEEAEMRERAEKRNRAQHLVQNIGMGQQTWPSDQRQPQQRQHVLQPHTSMQQPPVVMAQFVGHGAPPPTVAEAASKGQAMMGGPLPVAHVMSTQNPAIATTAVSRQVPRQAP